MVRLALGIILCSLLIGCNTKKDKWLTQPHFIYNGIWEVYHHPHLSHKELLWVRQSVAMHVRLSETTATTPFGNRAPRWVSYIPWTKPRIYIHGPRIKYLNSPIRIGVHSYADFKREAVHVVMGNKGTLPGLSRAVHQLRVGPDVWEQNAFLGWSLLIPNEALLVSTLEKIR